MTATDSALVFPDWPLMGGTLVPALTEVTSAHVLHRWVAAVVGLIVAAIAVVAWRTQRDRPGARRAWRVVAAVLYAIQVVVGGLQVLTALSGWAQTLHLALGAVIWALLVGLAVVELLRGAGDRGGSARPGTGDDAAGRARRRRPRPQRAATASAPTSP